MFAVAFLVVFSLIIIAFSYLLTILAYSFLRPLIPTQYWQGIKLTAYVLLASYLLTS